jgi:hypothetical protein
MCGTIKRVLANHATREIQQKFYEIMAVCAMCVGVNGGPVKMRLLSAFKRCASHDHMRNEITGIEQGLNIFFVSDKIRYNRKLPTAVGRQILRGRPPFPSHVKKRPK